jgi:RNA polymerase sigma-70 factor (ECF subfamily)
MRGATIPSVVQRKERFRELAADQLPRLYAVARRLVGDDAEDVVQDTLLKGCQGFDRLHDERAAGAWLVAILINVVRDRARAKARSVDEVNLDEVQEFSLYKQIAREDPFPYSDSLHLDFLRRFTKEDVKDVLLALPEIYRVPLVLVHMYGFSTKEVARMTDAPLGTVLARLHRGRKLFEKQMWDYARSNDLLLEEGAR